MSIIAYLEGGPWDGKALALNADVPVIEMWGPFEDGTVVNDEHAPPSDFAISTLQYKFHRCLPEDPNTRFYRLI